MKILPGFGSNLAAKKVCKLKKTLYELKQSLRAWFGRFEKVMKNMGYKQSHGNRTLFIKHSDLGGVTTLLVYVDDIIMMRNDELKKQTLRQCLTKEFEIKELGKLKYFLGIRLHISKKFLFLSRNM